MIQGCREFCLAWMQAAGRSQPISGTSIAEHWVRWELVSRAIGRHREDPQKSGVEDRVQNAPFCWASPPDKAGKVRGSCTGRKVGLGSGLRAGQWSSLKRSVQIAELEPFRSDLGQYRRLIYAL